MKKYILLASAMLFGFGCASSAAGSGLLDIEGGIYMKGFSRSTYLSIKDEKTGILYRIQSPKRFNLSHRQKEIVKLKARLVKKAVGPGFPAVIEVVEVEN